MNLFKRHLLFSLSILFSLFIFYSPLKQMVSFAIHNEIFSYIPFVPLVSSFFVYRKRAFIFQKIKYSFVAGAILIAAPCLFFVTGFLNSFSLNKNDYLSLMMFSLWLVWIGTFVLFYGYQTLNRALFPLLFLLFMIPPPPIATHAFIHILQKSSTEVVAFIFYALDLPVTREGYAFHFPQFSIEIWEDCSGIRSGIAFFITSAIASNLFLKRRWTILLAILSSVPVTIFKNAIRIVTLSVVGIYIDEDVFNSALHLRGGPIFFFLALLLLWVVIVLLQRTETALDKKKNH